MPQSLAQIYVHLIFSTKNRVPMLKDETRHRLHEYMGGILRGTGSKSIEINTIPDHAHILFTLSRTMSLSDTIAELKRGTSLWLKEIDPSYENFYWQSGYAAFSVSSSKVEVVRKYIQNQQAHHQQESYQDELRRWLHEYEIEYDERYVWD